MVLYMCPVCDALYCFNCSQAIADLENACWACNAPIDESKPVKPYMREEDTAIDVDILEHFLWDVVINITTRDALVFINERKQ